MMRVVLADPTGQIEREAADARVTLKSIALTYAFALRDEDAMPVDWARANRAIVAHRGDGALMRVKRRAWRLIDGKAKP